MQKMVEDAVAKALEGKEPGARGVPRRADLEEQAKRMVAEAAERLKAESAQEERIKKIEEKVQQEDAPEVMPRLRKLLWGGDK
jgi:hypothetical protein